MAEWWQQPYADRQAAGTVQTPGLVDWGGIYDALQAPYWSRQDREQGNAVADPISLYSKSNYVATPRPAATTPRVIAEDPITTYTRANYVAQPRFVGGGTPASPKVTLQNPYPGPTPVAKTQDRLAPSPVGLPLAGGVKPAAADPYNGYTASMRFASPNARSASTVITLVTEPMSEVSGQNTANSFGKPVRGPSGKTYYPSDTPMSGVRAPMKPVGNAPAVPGGQRQGGGLLSLFGSKGGILSTLFGGGASPRTAPVVTGGSPVLAASCRPAHSAAASPTVSVAHTTTGISRSLPTWP
jgi:hypothetical protein